MVAAVVIGCLLMLLPYATALTVKVEPKSEECFHEEVEENTSIEIIYDVIDGGLLDIEVKVRPILHHSIQSQSHNYF